MISLQIFKKILSNIKNILQFFKNKLIVNNNNLIKLFKKQNNQNNKMKFLQ